jgi:hypothetical protein
MQRWRHIASHDKRVQGVPEQAQHLGRILLSINIPPLSPIVGSGEEPSDQLVEHSGRSGPARVDPNGASCYQRATSATGRAFLNFRITTYVACSSGENVTAA